MKKQMELLFRLQSIDSNVKRAEMLQRRFEGEVKGLQDELDREAQKSSDVKQEVDALVKKKIAGAGLDVFEEEPLSPKSKLWELENVILTPHVGGSRRDYYQRVGEIFRINLNRYLGGKPLLNLYDKKLGY